MLFIADQHHLGDLEQFVLRYGRQYPLRLSGDTSPSMPNAYFYEKDEQEISILKGFQLDFKERKEMKRTVELSYAQKLEAHEEGIMNARKDLFRELVLLYGGATIFNLARKYVIHVHSKNGKTLCLAGNELTTEHAQRVIYQRIMQESNVKEDDVIEYIWRNLQLNGEVRWGLRTMILDHLDYAGIKGDGEEFILRQLSKSNYDGRIPTCLDVFNEHPFLDNFKFIEYICVEKKEDCVIVHVPYFSEESDRYTAEAFAKEDLRVLLEETGGDIPVINYHGNPCPEKMDDEGVRDRTDYNIIVINAVIQSVREAIAEGKEIKMICSHLHKSNPDYLWQEDRGEVRIYPLGTDDFAHLDTETGKIEVKKVN